MALDSRRLIHEPRLKVAEMPNEPIIEKRTRHKQEIVPDNVKRCIQAFGSSDHCDENRQKIFSGWACSINYLICHQVDGDFRVG